MRAPIDANGAKQPSGTMTTPPTRAKRGLSHNNHSSRCFPGPNDDCAADVQRRLID
jgi:hypothetical protein